MITRFFGLPGCGKTTVAAKIAYEALRSGRYQHVYGNVAISAPGYTYIPFTYVGRYMLEDCCLIIDEAAIECGNRDFKNFGKDRIEFFMTHRHYRARVILFSQEPDGIDIKIRSLTDRMFYIKKGLLLGHWISTVYRIPFGLVWPDENSNGENLGRIVMGYLKPSLLSRIFAQRIYRPKYYSLFDSWETKKLPPLPAEVTTVPGSIARNPWLWKWINKTAILLRWILGNVAASGVSSCIMVTCHNGTCQHPSAYFVAFEQGSTTKRKNSRQDGGCSFTLFRSGFLL